MDTDGDGLITPLEYARECQAWNYEFDYETTFKRLDLDGDGYLTQSEVTQLLQDFFFSNDPEARGNHLFGPVF